MDSVINLILFLVVLYILWQVYLLIQRVLNFPMRQWKQRGLARLPDNAKLANSIQQLNTVMQHINKSMQQTPRMSDAQKKEIRAQVQEVQRNIASLLWKMDHVLAMRSSVQDPVHQLDLMKMQHKLKAEIDRSLEVLEATSVALLKFDVQSGERGAARLLSDLTEASERLANTGDSYEEMQRIGRLSRH
jgi:uncharacterized phage infection (PIP) family protein YhgE